MPLKSELKCEAWREKMWKDADEQDNRKEQKHGGNVN